MIFFFVIFYIKYSLNMCGYLKYTRSIVLFTFYLGQVFDFNFMKNGK